MNVLVTGGSGFIGTKLVEHLLDLGHNVRIFDIRGSEAYPDLVARGDVRDRDALVAATEGCDIAYHLAAEHHDNVRPVSLYHDVNVGGAQNLIEAVEAAGANEIVFTSTIAVYGLAADTPGEDYPPKPFNEYGLSKLESERLFEEWARRGPPRSLVTVRPSVIFGESNRGNVYNLLRQIRSGGFIMVGQGSNRKSMGYVVNLARFLVFAAGRGPGVSVFNYADKPDLTMAELVRIARDALGKKHSRITVPYAAALAAGYAMDGLGRLTGARFSVSAVRIRKFCADTAIRTDRLDETGFERPYTLEEGLKRMIGSDFPVTRPTQS
jgi:nucleoside-diphosphate-sugar epimerase